MDQELEKFRKAVGQFNKCSPAEIIKKVDISQRTRSSKNIDNKRKTLETVVEEPKVVKKTQKNQKEKTVEKANNEVQQTEPQQNVIKQKEKDDSTKETAKKQNEDEEPEEIEMPSVKKKAKDLSGILQKENTNEKIEIAEKKKLMSILKNREKQRSKELETLKELEEAKKQQEICTKAIDDLLMDPKFQDIIGDKESFRYNNFVVRKFESKVTPRTEAKHIAKIISEVTKNRNDSQVIVNEFLDEVLKIHKEKNDGMTLDFRKYY